METRTVNQQPNSQWTAVQTAPMAARPSADHVKDYLPWSIFTCLFLNCCCLGLAAIVFSVKTRNRKVTGDVNEATSYSSTTRTLNIVSTVLSIIFIVIIIILQATGAIKFYSN